MASPISDARRMAADMGAVIRSTIELSEALLSTGLGPSRRAASIIRISSLRAVARATDSGIPQRTIAKDLSVTQPEVSRTLKKLRLNPAARQRSPREVLLEYAAQRLDHDAMMAELTAWPYAFGHVAVDDPAAESYVRGSWDQIERAGDLLGDDDYRVLLAATADRCAGECILTLPQRSRPSSKPGAALAGCSTRTVLGPRSTCSTRCRAAAPATGSSRPFLPSTPR